MTIPDSEERERLAKQNRQRHRPRTPPLAAPGESYFDLVAKHGRPVGVFEDGRTAIYKAR
jgi:hypothetical protein